ncbi:MAG: hypothetical protein ACFN4U_02490 [Candidatus Absconditicoccaceae bacterium]
MKEKTKNLGMLLLISLVIIGLYIESCKKIQRNPSQNENNLQFPPAAKDTLTWRDSLEDVQAQLANEEGTRCLIDLYERQNGALLAPRGSFPLPAFPNQKVPRDSPWHFFLLMKALHSQLPTENDIHTITKHPYIR